MLYVLIIFLYLHFFDRFSQKTYMFFEKLTMGH